MATTVNTERQEDLTMATTADLVAAVTVPAQTRTIRRGRRLLRKLARVLRVGIALVLGLALVGASYEAISATGDAQEYPAPGKLVDVGGYRLHIKCVGTGSPTVVLDAGLGGLSLAWDLVQKEMGQTTQVCAYDRAGMGWSDTGPQPRTPGLLARELHALLTNAGIPGPYVLVGHSLGGKNMRMFALQYPEEVAGMVLVDARSEHVDAPTSPTDAQEPHKPSGDQVSLYGVARRLGLVRLIGGGPWGPPAMSDRTRMAIALLTTGQRAINAEAAETREMTADNAELQAAPSLGDRPLIVLAAEESVNVIPRWTEAQHRQAALSMNGRLIVVEGSGHYIQFDQPAVVIDAVQQVVTQVRGR